jgi:hypothetical protein
MLNRVQVPPLATAAAVSTLELNRLAVETDLGFRSKDPSGEPV